MSYLISDSHGCVLLGVIDFEPHLNSGFVQVLVDADIITVTVTDPRVPGSPIVNVMNPGDPALVVELQDFGCIDAHVQVDITPGIIDPTDHYDYFWDFQTECCSGINSASFLIDCGPTECGGG